MAFNGISVSLFVLLASLYAWAHQDVTISKSSLDERLLLQISYQLENGRQDLMTSRSRVVTLQREDETLRVVEEPRDSRASPHLLATIPIRGETPTAFIVDFNAGFDRVFNEEDRTGEDYYGRVDRQDYSFFRLSQRKIVRVSHNGSMLALRQEALNEREEPVLVHYYLSPYRASPGFEPFEVENLDHFGLYQTYPQHRSGRTVLFAMKFDAHTPIVFALSSEIPARSRQAVRDGVLYWNKALGSPLLHVIDAPEGVGAPNPQYNVIQWVADGGYAATSHIQGDPLTGEILHAHIFIPSRTLNATDSHEQNDHLRYVVAHEVGHALGLRHNFAKGPVSTVMNYFRFERALQIGREVVPSGNEALEYDRKVIRHVYLGEALNTDALPTFCTDSQRRCRPRSLNGPVPRLASH
jgi:hypothetical protein